MIKHRSKPRRVSVARDPKYLQFLRDYGDCSACGRFWVVCEPAHGPRNGMSSKGSDLDAAPLCHDCHLEEHRIGFKNFWANRKYTREAVVAYWNAKYRLESGEYKGEMSDDESSQ